MIHMLVSVETFGQVEGGGGRGKHRGTDRVELAVALRKPLGETAQVNKLACFPLSPPSYW